MPYISVPLDQKHMKKVARAWAAQGKNVDVQAAIRAVYPGIRELRQILLIWSCFCRSLRFWEYVIEAFRLSLGKNFRGKKRGPKPDPINAARRSMKEKQVISEG